MAGNGPGKVIWIIMIILVLLVWFFYKEPVKTHDFVNPALQPVDNWLTTTFKWGGTTAATPAATATVETVCPATDDKVCGSDGKTYKNICYATYNDILTVTPGACE